MATVCENTVGAGLPEVELKRGDNRQVLASLLTLVKPPLLVFLGSRTICFLAGYLTLLIFPMHNATHWRWAPHYPMVDWTARWDSGWYAEIAKEGYSYNAGKASSVAFFPLYPHVVGIVSKVVGRPILAALIFDHLAFLGALIYLYALGLRVLPDQATVLRFLWLEALFPTAFFFSVYYSESLFLFLCAGAFYHLHRRQWGWAVLFATAGSACRVPGVFLYGVLMLEWMKDAGWSLAAMFRGQAWRNLGQGVIRHWRTLLLIQASVLGLIGYMGFLFVRFGHPLRFQQAQAGFGWQTKNPLQVILEQISQMAQAFTDGSHDYVAFLAYFNLFCFLAGLALCVGVWRKLGESYACFCLASLLLPACLTLTSITRYGLVLCPLFMALSIHLRNPWLYRIFLTLSVVLLIVFTGLFATWRFVA